MESPNSALAIQGPVLTPAQQNQENMNKLESAVTELLVSSYDPVVGKTIWQCAQCHFSSKVRYTVKQHIETHLAGFTHQCPSCEKTCKTRNALRAHVMRAHTDRPPSSNQNNQNWQMQSNQTSPVMSPDGFMQVFFATIHFKTVIITLCQNVGPVPRDWRADDEEASATSASSTSRRGA